MHLKGFKKGTNEMMTWWGGSDLERPMPKHLHLHLL